VTLIEPIGDEQIIHVTLEDGVELVATAPPDSAIAADDHVSLRVAPDTVHLFSARDGTRIEGE
jgi:ABC-type sugar transport system ATPase subunit